MSNGIKLFRYTYQCESGEVCQTDFRSHAFEDIVFREDVVLLMKEEKVIHTSRVATISEKQFDDLIETFSNDDDDPEIEGWRKQLFDSSQHSNTDEEE